MMAAIADVHDRPDWLKSADKVAFDRYLASRRRRPRGAALLAIVDLAHDVSPSVEFHVSGAAWQHELALAAELLQRLTRDPELRNAEIMQARLQSAIEALDVRNIWLTTGPVK